MLETIGDRPLGQGEPPVFQVLEESGRGTTGVELVDQDRDPDRDPELASGNETRGGRSDRDPRRVLAGTGFPVPGSPEFPLVGLDRDLDDVGLFRGAVGRKGGMTGGAVFFGRLMNLDRGGKLCMTCSPRALSAGLMSFFSLRPLPGLLEVHQLFQLGGQQRRRWILRIACGILFRGIPGRRRIAFFGLFAVEVLLQGTNRPLQLNDLAVSGGDDLLVFFVALLPPGKSLSVRAGEAVTIRVEKLFRRGRPFAGSGRIGLGEDLWSLHAPVVA